MLKLLSSSVCTLLLASALWLDFFGGIDRFAKGLLRCETVSVCDSANQAKLNPSSKSLSLK